MKIYIVVKTKCISIICFVHHSRFKTRHYISPPALRQKSCGRMLFIHRYTTLYKDVVFIYLFCHSSLRYTCGACLYRSYMKTQTWMLIYHAILLTFSTSLCIVKWKKWLFINNNILVNKLIISTYLYHSSVTYT